MLNHSSFYKKTAFAGATAIFLLINNGSNLLINNYLPQNELTKVIFVCLAFGVASSAAYKFNDYFVEKINNDNMPRV